MSLLSNNNKNINPSICNENSMSMSNSNNIDVSGDDNDGPKLSSTLGVENDIICPNSRYNLHRPKMYGHRGSLYEEPENTIPSFQKAIDYGLQGVELDVFLLKCGKLVVFHGDGDDHMPGGLLGYCGIDDTILNLTAHEVQQLQFQPSSDNGNGAYYCPNEKLNNASIPMLEEVLQHAKKNGYELKIELKSSNIEKPVIELIEKMNMVKQCTISSFYHNRIAKVRELRPQRNKHDGSHIFKTGALFAGNIPNDFITRAKQVDATEIHLRYDTCTKDRIEQIHSNGFKSLSWFRSVPGMEQDIMKFQDLYDENEQLYEMVLHSGVEAMCVNHPKRLVNLVSNIENSSSCSCESESSSSTTTTTTTESESSSDSDSECE